MPTIVIAGAGPGLSLAVARKYGLEGYTVVLVSRSQDKLDDYVEQLGHGRIQAHALTADLSHPEDMDPLAKRIRDVAGPPDVLYYAPTSPELTFVPAAELSTHTIEFGISLLLTSFAALIRQFLPHMLQQGSGAILTGQGATALAGRPGMSGPGPAMAAQRNYLQSLEQELEDRGVFVGRIYINALIEHSAIHRSLEAAGKNLPAAALIDPDKLAQHFWDMQAGGKKHELEVPALAKLMSPLMNTKAGKKAMTKFMS